MGESTAVKAIIIGASLLIALMTITAVIAYYNTAVDTVRKIGPGSNIAENYRSDIVASISKESEKLKGTEVKNLVNYFYKNSKVQLIFTNIPILDNKNSTYDNLKYKATNLVITDDINYNLVNRNILPMQNFEFTRTYESDTTMVLTFKAI